MQASNQLSSLNVRAGIGQSVQLRYKISALRNGVEIEQKPWVSHLILDSGLNKVASFVWPSLIAWAHFGSSPSPVPTRRDSSPITLTQAANIVTSSGGFFSSADIGRLIKYNDGPGTEVYITGFTNATTVTVGTSFTLVIPTAATIWYVNETALTSQFDSSSTAGSGGSDNGTSATSNVVTWKKTIIGNAVASALTCTEVGFSEATSNTNLFDRDVITGGIPLAVGDQPKVVIELSCAYTPITSTSVGNVGTGMDSSGNFMIEAFGQSLVNGNTAMAYIDTTGNVSGQKPFDPSGSGGTDLITDAITFGTFAGFGPAPHRNGVQKSASVQSYTPGAFQIDQITSWTLPQAIGTYTGFCLGEGNGTDIWCYWTQAFATPFSKDNTQTLTITVTKFWQRVLVN